MFQRCHHSRAKDARATARTTAPGWRPGRREGRCLLPSLFRQAGPSGSAAVPRGSARNATTSRVARRVQGASAARPSGRSGGPWRRRAVGWRSRFSLSGLPGNDRESVRSVHACQQGSRVAGSSKMRGTAAACRGGGTRGGRTHHRDPVAAANEERDPVTNVERAATRPAGRG